MTEQDFGYIVVRDVPEGDSNLRPFVEGDPITTYKLGERLDKGDAANCGGHPDPTKYEAFVLKHAVAADWKLVQSHRCDCYREVAQTLMHLPSEQLWITIKPERIPNAFRKDAPAVEGHVILPEPCGMVHAYGVASCKGCDKRWLVAAEANTSEPRLVRLLKATHGARVAP